LFRRIKEHITYNYRNSILLLTIVFCALLIPSTSLALPQVNGYRLEEVSNKARLTFNVTELTQYRTFLRTDPDHQIIIDLIDTRWEMDKYPRIQENSLVHYIDQTLKRDGTLRISLKLKEAVTIEQSIFSIAESGNANDNHLVITFSSTSGSPFAINNQPASQKKKSAGKLFTQADRNEMVDFGYRKKSPLGFPTFAPSALPASLASQPIPYKQPIQLSNKNTKAKKPSSSKATATNNKPPKTPKTKNIPASLAYKNRNKSHNSSPSAPQSPPRKAVIVIDAGHGGVDPGAIGKSGKYEKNITLLYAKTLRTILEKSGRYKVILTRDRDVYVPLSQRVKRAQKSKADLLISLHADSHKNSNTRGLSVYTLSKKRAKREARKLLNKADKETVIHDIDLRKEDDDLQNMIIQMAQRRTTNNSTTFAEMIVEELGNSARLLRNTHRSAGFMVLTGADVPSVLIELGYMSNKDEERLLQKRKYRAKLVKGIMSAIDRYFEDFPPQ